MNCNNYLKPDVGYHHCYILNVVVFACLSKKSQKDSSKINISSHPSSRLEDMIDIILVTIATSEVKRNLNLLWIFAFDRRKIQYWLPIDIKRYRKHTMSYPFGFLFGIHMEIGRYRNHIPSP